MGNNDVDNKLLKWNDIFEELIVDARMLTKDLLQGVNYVGASGVVMIALGLVFLMYNIGQFWRGGLFIGIVLLSTGVDVIIGLWNILKFLQLRKRYRKLYALQTEMDSR